MKCHVCGIVDDKMPVFPVLKYETKYVNACDQHLMSVLYMAAHKLLTINKYDTEEKSK